MAIAHGISKQTIFKVQSALGTAASGAGGQLLRRRTSVFQLTKDTYASDEMVTHQQATTTRHGLRATSGRIAGLLSPATFKEFIESALRRDFAAGATTGAIITVTAAAANPQFVRSGGSFLTDGFKVFDVIRWTGWVAAANNARNFLITALTATDMTGIFLDGTAVVAEAEGVSVTGAVVGKKTYAPLTGHTNKYHTFEEWYADISRSELFVDNKVGQIAFGLPASGNTTIDIDLIGLNRVLAAAQVLTTPTDETSTDILTAVRGILRVNDNTIDLVTGAQITLVTGLTPDGPVVGSNSSPDISTGRIVVTGQFSAYFEDADLQELYDDETVLNLGMLLTADQTATADFMGLSLGRIKLNGDAPDDGEKGIVRTFPFTAEINTAGGTALANDKTIMTVQDSAA